MLLLVEQSGAAMMYSVEVEYRIGRTEKNLATDLSRVSRPSRPASGAEMEHKRLIYAPTPRNADHKTLIYIEFIGRGKRIRTSGPCVPNAVLYQAELFPDEPFRKGY